MELIIEANDDGEKGNRAKINIQSLIFNKKVYEEGPKIVVIGGGHGFNTVIEGLKKYTNNITAIVTMSDYGRNTTVSRVALDSLPLNDIKDSIIAMSDHEELMKNLMEHKFSNERLYGLNFGDVYLTAMNEIYSNISEAILKSTAVLNITGKVIPVTLDEMNITAELANGYVVTEKSKIPEIVYDKVTKINRIYLNPTNCRPAPGVLEAIKEADCIIIGPGSLYTNVIPNLLVNGVAKAIKENTGLKVYISNIMTEPGQTDEYSVSDHLNAIIEHCGKGIVDYCIYDTGEIVPEFIKRYNLEGQDLVIPDVDKIKGITFLQRNLSMITNDCIRHDPELVAESIISLICDDLRYQDKQNDPQYLMLNNKLKEDKRINKIKKQMKKDEKKGRKEPKKRKGNSKFSNKYSDRIESIKKSSEMEKLKAQKMKKEEKKAKKVKKDSDDTKAPVKRRKKTPQEIREEMLRKLEESNLK